MTTKQKTVDKTTAALMDEAVELEHRKMTLANICMDDSKEANQIVSNVLNAAANANAESVYQAKNDQLNEIMQALNDGPLRIATYIGKCPDTGGSAATRVQVMLENGDSTYPLVTDSQLAESLRCGESVLIDAQARCVLFRGATEVSTGEIAELRARVETNYVDISLHDHDHHMFRISDALKEKLDAEEVKPGARLLVCPKRKMAFSAMPDAEGVSHYRFLVTDPVPDVVVGRDIGCPPAFIEELSDHIYDHMTNPELGQKYRTQAMQTRLLAGISGCGKTLSVLGSIRRGYEVMSKVTGVALEDLPNRVLQMRSPKILSQWLGASDKNLDLFFDEAIRLAQEPFVDPDGREWKLPVFCRCEEIDALARARGTSDPTYDRIQTTMLERFDQSCKNLANELIIFMFTTNIPEACDTAFVRRAAGEIVYFGRVEQRQFSIILSKHLRELPFREDMGLDKDLAQRRVCRDVAHWMFSRNGHDPGQLEVTYAGSSTPVVKKRLDLLTGSVIDRAVQQAKKEACRLERQGVDQPGLTSEMIIDAFDSQIGGICDQINEHNAHNYLTLPEGVRVGNVRRIRQPAVQTFQLDRSTT